MARTNIITASFLEGRTDARTIPIWQWDYGQILQIEGIDLPTAFEAHFSNTPAVGDSVTMIGSTTEGVSQVDIPDALLDTGKNVYAFIFLHTGLADGETVYRITVPVNDRPQPEDEEPTPEQQSAIDQAITALNAAVAQTQASEEAAADSAEAAAGSAEQASGSAEDAEAWAVGQRGGVDVPVTDETYENNSKFYAGRAAAAASDAAGSAGVAYANAQTATEKAGEAAGSASAAAGSADAAEDAADRAEQAAGASGYMFFEIDEDGHLVYARTDTVTADFDIDEDGHLVLI